MGHMHTETSSKTLSSQVRDAVRDSEESREQPVENRRRDRRFVPPRGIMRNPCRPFEVNGAELELRSVLFGKVPAFWTSWHEVVNVSKGGLAFETRRPMARGAKVLIQFWIPGHDTPLELIAETRWSKRAGGVYNVGVQFAPFGKQPGMNALHTLEALRALESACT